MIDFQRNKDFKRPEPAQVSVQGGEQLYAQVNKSHTSHNQETIYAEVKKKWMYLCSIFFFNKCFNLKRKCSQLEVLCIVNTPTMWLFSSMDDIYTVV